MTTSNCKVLHMCLYFEYFKNLKTCDIYKLDSGKNVVLHIDSQINKPNRNGQYENAETIYRRNRPR